MKNFLINGLIALFSLFFALAVAEIGFRTVKKDPVARPVHGLSKTEKISWAPYFSRIYKTNEYSYELKTNRFGRRDIDW